MTQPQRLTHGDLDRIVVHNVNEFGWHLRQRDRRRRPPNLELYDRPLRNLATPRTDHDRPIARRSASEEGIRSGLPKGIL